MRLALDIPLPPDPREVAVAAIAAEEAGADGVWSAETGHDPYLPLAIAAASTGRVRLGSSIAVAFPRSPLVHAQAAWDLALLAPGRVILGLGPQVRAHNERRYGVAGDHPAARMRDMLRAIRAIWHCWETGEPLHYEGEFYHHTLMTPFFSPERLDGAMPAIHIAAVGELMLDVAGSEADGLHIHPFHTVGFLREHALPLLHNAALAAGRNGTVETVASVLVATGDCDEDVKQAREAVRAHVAFYASTPAYRFVLEQAGYGELFEPLHRLSIEGDWAGMGTLIPDSLLDLVIVSGTFSRLGELLFSRYGGVVDRIAPVIPLPSVPWRQIVDELSLCGEAATRHSGGSQS